MTAVYGRSRAWSMPYVAPSGGGGGVVWRGQEPVGYTQLTARDYNVVSEDSWSIGAAGGSTANFTIVSDPTAPRSPNNVGQINYPTSPIAFADGTEPCILSHGASGNKLYVCKYFKLSTNWVGHPTGTNKIVHYKMDSTGTTNRVFSVGYGDGANPMAPGFGLQGIASNFDFNAQGGGFSSAAQSGWLFPNQPGHTNDAIPRGTWQQWEHLIQLGSAGNADGRIQWWIDGVLIGDYINIPLINLTAAFTEIDWAPTWGGFNGSTLTVDQQQFMDALYMSTHA